jgi:predicted O-methyltransferase YrrM
VDERVAAIIDRLGVQAAEHDAVEPDRLRRWRVLEPDAGRFLWYLVQATRARDVAEVGTSRGVSTLWLADALRATGGTVVSVDVDGDAQREAGANIGAAGLTEQVRLRTGDGADFLAGLPDESLDLLFLDAERTEYTGWWPHPRRVLRPGGSIVIDNALSHPDEVAPLRELLAADPALTTTTLALGKGELLALRSS